MAFVGLGPYEVRGWLEGRDLHVAVHDSPRSTVVSGSDEAVRELLAREGIRHLTTEPYRPRTNGKVERFHQTMAREWAYGVVYRSHRQRNQALPHWLNHYNRRRPHSSLGDRPPISRIHNVRGQDTT